ncbi:APL6 (YGR261C) [Zygosaccharomyces parabailii]|nr:APL6 (YGR261C) [Zygosaccharomyces parabailii]
MVDSIYRIASALESARVITMDAAVIASSKLGETSYTTYSKSITPEQLRHLLNSRNPREIKDGMKRIISIMSSGETFIDAESYFADVVKNIISNDAKVKKMVCIYLLRYAEKDPDLALLSVNSIQKAFSDVDPEIRSSSIKALSDMKIPSLFPVVLYILKKAVNDPAEVVRSSVAFAMLKLYREQGQEVEEELKLLLQELLSDASPLVISAAIVVFRECFSQHLEWLHGHYRYYCQIMRELDLWAQESMVDLLVLYCKTYLPRPIILDVSAKTGNQRSIPMPNKFNEIPFPVYDVINNPDLSLFLECLKPLVHSFNPSVILSCSNAFYQLATPMQFKESGFPQALVRTVVSTDSIGVKISLLQTILLFSFLDSSLMLPYIKKFFVLPSDDTKVAGLKLKILSNLINEFNVEVIVDQLKFHISTSHSSELVISAANTLAVCGQLSGRWESHVMKWFINHMETSKLPNAVLDSYVNVIRLLNPTRHLRIIIKLSEVLESQKVFEDNVRAGIVWLFGEIAAVEYRICPDVLRKLIPGFSSEGPETRCQILMLSAKLLSHEIDTFKEQNEDMEYDIDNSRIGQMYKAVAYLAEFDEEYDIRDRARCFSSLFYTGKFEIATLLLQAPKPSPGVHPSSSHSSEENLYPHETDWNSLGLDSSAQKFHKIIPWNDEIFSEKDDIRMPAPLKDYSRYKKSFSSDSFASRNMIKGTSSISSNDMITENNRHSEFSPAQGKKYRLQTLEEFFSDIPAKQPIKAKKKIVTGVSSDDDDDDDDDDTNGEEDSSTEETDGEGDSDDSSSSSE